MGDRRSRHPGRGRRHRAGLHHEYVGRPSPRPVEQQRALRHRLDRRAGAAASAGDRAGLVRRGGDRDRASRAGTAVARRAASLARGHGAGRGPGRRGRGLGERHYARQRRLPHPHLRHRRIAQGRDDDAWQHPRQLPWRGAAPRDDRARRRGLPVVPAAVALLRAHRRHVLPDRARRADLFRREGRDARLQHARGAPDHHDRRAAALRDDAPAHPAPDGARRRIEGEAVLRRAADRQKAHRGFAQPHARRARARTRCSTGWCARR